MDSDKVPTLSLSNGFVYPPKQHGLPVLDLISSSLVSRRLTFMQISRLRYDGSYGILGQCTPGCGRNNAAITASIGR
ncbi:hypothetical protein TNCV_425001 [Trichonephila clavipes]|nr:hypothetical protein TNCV_425001 [Trichonephila clavipes]